MIEFDEHEENNYKNKLLNALVKAVEKIEFNEALWTFALVGCFAIFFFTMKGCYSEKYKVDALEHKVELERIRAEENRMNNEKGK